MTNERDPLMPMINRPTSGDQIERNDVRRGPAVRRRSSNSRLRRSSHSRRQHFAKTRSTAAVLNKVYSKRSLVPHKHDETEATQLRQQQLTTIDSNYEECNEHPTTKKSFLYTLLNPRSAKLQAVCFKYFITTVILVDFIIFIFSTEPGLQDKDIKLFDRAEQVSSTIFLIEYLARLLTVTEAKKYGDLGQIWGRLRYMVTYSAIIDAAATAPYFLQLLTGYDLPTLTILRTFRLFRILKLNEFVEATNSMWRVIKYNRQILHVSWSVCILLVLTTSVLMYYLRPPDDSLEPGARNEFESMSATIYLSTLMLTGQGGPEGDLPWYTKGVVLLTGIFSIGMFAIPASMLTWGFEAEAERCAKRARQLSKQVHSPSECNQSGEWSSSSEEYSSDEEYQKIIAGEDSSEDDSSGDERRKAAMERFSAIDTDHSGTISMREYLEDVLHPPADASGKIEARMAALESKVDDILSRLDKMSEIMEAVASKS